MTARAEAGRSGPAFDALARGAEALRNLTGWRRASVAFAAGSLSALSFAPFGIFPLLLLAIAVLVILLDGAQLQKRPHASAAWIGWCWAFGQFLFGLYWVGYAFLVDAASHAWQIPFVEFFLPGGLALFIAAATFGASFFWRPGASRIFVLTIAYVTAEWLRGHILTGFPWNIPAYGWSASLAVLQSTAIFGSYGLSLLTILFGASLAQCVGLKRSDSRAWHLPAAMTALFLVFWIGGVVRLWLVHPGDVSGVMLRLVQPNVAQQEKFKSKYRLRNWQELIDLSNRSAARPSTHIIWPEAAPPLLLTRSLRAMEDVAALTGSSRVLMTGAIRGYATIDDGIRYSNSFYIFGAGGSLVATYDKFHLVPFGEYLPFSDLLGKLGLTKVVDGPEGFAAGEGPRTFAVPDAPPVGPLICYEIIFPGEVVGSRRPGWFVNVTDDSWFGPSTGPYQHLLIARVRAIEEGLPVARDANTGISAVIDPLGRVRAELGLGVAGVLDSPLPGAVPKTPFARFGDVGFALMLIALLWGAWRRSSEKLREKSFS
jgi:apolipoprotein N-acyltransferase